MSLLLMDSELEKCQKYFEEPYDGKPKLGRWHCTWKTGQTLENWTKIGITVINGVEIKYIIRRKIT